MPQGPFPAYLQGMEMVDPEGFHPRHPDVPSLPTRNGNGSSSRLSGSGCIGVPSLPTRNGNKFSTLTTFQPLIGSQPTYKEWKWGQRLRRRAWGAQVPSLPTRNGNRAWPRASNWRTPWFPAYLQGMEIRASSMRWCSGLLSSQPTYKEWKCSRGRLGDPLHGRSQPTYKEWK